MKKDLIPSDLVSSAPVIHIMEAVAVLRTIIFLRLECLMLKPRIEARYLRRLIVTVNDIIPTPAWYTLEHQG